MIGQFIALTFLLYFICGGWYHIGWLISAIVQAAAEWLFWERVRRGHVPEGWHIVEDTQEVH